MTQPLVDIVAWPVVYITFAPMASVDEVEGYLHTLEPLYQRGQLKPFITVADLSHVSPTSLSAALRSKLAAGLSDLDRRYPNAKAGEGVIIGAGVTRAAYSAMNLVRARVKYERKVFATKAEAREWARLLAVKVLSATA